MDFGSNPSAPASSKRKKDEESAGIGTIELANGQRLDGYLLVTAKNAAKMGISPDQLKTLVEGKKKGTVQVTLHLQFGERDLTVAEAVAIDFA